MGILGTIEKPFSKRLYSKSLKPVSREEIAKRTEETNPIHRLKGKRDLIFDLNFQEFFFSRPQPDVKYHRKRSPNYRYIK